MRILVLSSLLFGSLTAFAQNSLIRACRLTQGQFFAVPIPGDEVAFCQYGEAAVDASSILKLSTSKSRSLAVAFFKAGPFQTCESAQAENLTTLDMDGRTFDICQFSDDSLMEQSTLQRGPQHPLNRGLVKALETHF